MPTKNVFLELVQGVGESYIRSIDIEPNSYQAQITMIVIFGEVKRVIAGLVDV